MFDWIESIFYDGTFLLLLFWMVVGWAIIEGGIHLVGWLMSHLTWL